MSVDYCHKHHNYYDTDFETECSLCVEDEVEQSEQKEDNKVFFIHGVRQRNKKLIKLNGKLDNLTFYKNKDKDDILF